MRKKVKISLAFILIVFMTSCSALRKGRMGTETGTNNNMGYDAVIERVIDNNITDEGFILRKGRIEIDGSGLDGSYGFNARYSRSGELNASVRGPLGIELIRLLSIDGEVYLVDRIGRTVYTGRTKEVLRKYGLPDNVIAIIFGDFASEGTESYSMAGKERIMVSGEVQNLERVVSICVDEEKVCEEIYRDLLTGNEVQLKYENFRNTEEKKYASEIYLDLKKSNLRIGMKIDELTCGYDEDITFTMPSYKRRSL